MKDAHKAISYHDRISAGWDERYRSGSFARRHLFVSEHVLSGLSDSGHWLDAGCGAGTFSRMLLARGANRVTGVDGAEGMVHAARELAHREGLDASLDVQHIKTIEHLHFPDASFDAAICFSVLEYLSEPENALAELARVLRPNARCIVSIPHERSLLRQLQRVGRPSAMGSLKPGLAYLDSSSFTLSPADAHSFFARSGFHLVVSKAFDPYLPRLLFPILSPSMIFYDLVRVGAVKARTL